MEQPFNVQKSLVLLRFSAKPRKVFQSERIKSSKKREGDVSYWTIEYKMKEESVQIIIS